MIYITGDMHGFWDFGKISRFANENPNLKKEDYLIICGDFGLIWNWTETGNSIESNPKDTHWVTNEIFQKNTIDKFPFTTLFVDGNHENYDRLKTYPVSEWNGGKVQKITDSIIHLMRGEVYEIDGVKLFAFGGAASHDRGPATGTEFIDEGVCWWPDEICSQGERDNAVENLKKHDNKVDMIITHCLSDKRMMQMGFADFNATSNFLWGIEDTVEFRQWYCGHYHRDEWLSPKIRILYNDIVNWEE